MAEACAARVVALERPAAGFAGFAGFKGGQTAASNAVKNIWLGRVAAKWFPWTGLRDGLEVSALAKGSLEGPYRNAWLRHVLRESLPWKGLQRGLRVLRAGPAVPNVAF